jgi:micrococcal nuclease
MKPFCRLAPFVLLGLALLWMPFASAGTPRPDSEPYYVASVKAEPFHRPSCTWAKKIAPHNLQTFQSREDAIKAGHRPCKVCKP